VSADNNSAAWFTIAATALPSTVAAIYRGALAAQRHRIEGFSIDVLSDEPWPIEVTWAVEELDARIAASQQRPRRWWLRWLPRGGGPTVDLDLTNDRDFELAMTIAPYTIGGTGISDRQQIIWDGNDTGTSGAFQLETSELEVVKQFVTDHGGDPDQVVPLPRTRSHAS